MALVKRMKTELLALLDDDPVSLEHAKNLSRAELVPFLLARPKVMQAISFRFLTEAGFGEGHYLQRSRDGLIFRLIRCQVTFDERGLPLTVGLIGVQDGLDEKKAGHIGRIEEFTSMETGLQLLGSELLELLD